MQVDFESPLESSVRAMHEYRSKYLERPKSKAANFPVRELSSFSKGISTEGAIYIKAQFARAVPVLYSGKNNIPKRTVVSRERWNAIRLELGKTYKEVHNFNEILESVIEKVRSDEDLENKMINLNEEQLLNALSKLVALKLLQETFERLDEKDKANFKREALRESKFE